jgi:hypothetical protein
LSDGDERGGEGVEDLGQLGRGVGAGGDEAAVDRSEGEAGELVDDGTPRIVVEREGQLLAKSLERGGAHRLHDGGDLAVAGARRLDREHKEEPQEVRVAFERLRGVRHHDAQVIDGCADSFRQLRHIGEEARRTAFHDREQHTPMYLEDGTGNTEWMAAHGAFHAALASAAGSPVLERVRRQLYDASELYRYWSGTLPHRVGRSNVEDEHKAILDAALAPPDRRRRRPRHPAPAGDRRRTRDRRRGHRWRRRVDGRHRRGLTPGDPAMSASTTTVVVARTIRPGRAREAERWIGRLLRAVAAAPGFLGSTAHEPSVAHPDEWLVVYSFESAAALEAWLSSPERQTLIASGAGLFADEVREQRLADRVAADTVTLVSSVTLRPGVEATYRGLYDEGVQAAGDSGGLVRAELLPALAGVQPETVALLTFASRDDLDRWLASAARQDVLARMEPLLAGARTLNVVGGFAGWFTAGPVKPKRWKQALTVFVCLVPVSLVATLVRIDLLPHAPLPLAVVLGSAANVVVLTWLVMPIVTRRFEPWLVR